MESVTMKPTSINMIDASAKNIITPALATVFR